MVWKYLVCATLIRILRICLSFSSPCSCICKDTKLNELQAWLKDPRLCIRGANLRVHMHFMQRTPFFCINPGPTFLKHYTNGLLLTSAAAASCNSRKFSGFTTWIVVVALAIAFLITITPGEEWSIMCTFTIWPTVFCCRLHYAARCQVIMPVIHIILNSAI